MKRTKAKKNNYEVIRILVSVVLLILSAAGMVLAARLPAFAQWYSEYIYSKLVSTIGRVSGILHFSVSEIGIYVLLIVFFFTFFLMIKKFVKNCQGKSGRIDADVASKPDVFVTWFSGVLLGVGILVFLYVSCCGINYYRRSFSEEEKIITNEYSSDELKEVCLWLTQEVNMRAESMSRDGDGVMELDAPEEEGAVEAMYKLGSEYDSLAGYYPRPKKLILSEILSYQGLTGIYLPFTVEANYNGDMTPYNKPFTACHELSHLRGFMQEQEANYIAFLACITSERADFQYSGYLSGWIYCMNALYRTDQQSWLEVRLMLDSAAEPDLTANDEFWDSYEGKISETAEKINDTYLKVNGQADGVKSYDKMVDLIVAAYKQYSINGDF